MGLEAHLVRMRTRWSDVETKIFIDVFKQWEERLRTFQGKKRDIWARIQKHFVRACAKLGVETDKLDVRQTEDRYRYLVKEYTRMKENPLGGQLEKKPFRFYDEMDEIFTASNRQDNSVADVLHISDDSEDGHGHENNENENIVVTENKVERERRGRGNKTKTAFRQDLKDVVTCIQDNMREQTRLIGEQNARDNAILKQFLDANERSEKRQQDLIEAILRKVGNS